jgi:hypothetical protein
VPLPPAGRSLSALRLWSLSALRLWSLSALRLWSPLP